jgi:hypothetical protein
MDIAATREESSKSPAAPNLMMTPEVERDLENWRMTGVPPFLELSHFPHSYWVQVRKADLRLIHHIVGLSNDFRQRGLSETTVWVPKMHKYEFSFHVIRRTFPGADPSLASWPSPSLATL